MKKPEALDAMVEKAKTSFEEIMRTIRLMFTAGVLQQINKNTEVQTKPTKKKKMISTDKDQKIKSHVWKPIKEKYVRIDYYHEKI